MLIILFSSIGHWELEYENVVYGLYGVDFVDTSNGWVVGDSGIVLRTRDGGNTWDTLWTPKKVVLTDLSFVDTSKGWVCGDSGYIAKTGDGGNTWDVESTETQHYLCSIRFLDSLYGWAGVRGDSFLLKTVDGGKNWTKVPFVPILSYGWVSISLVNKQTLWVLRDTYLRLYKSNNSGNDWILKFENAERGGLRVFALDSLHIWFTADSLGYSNYSYYVYRSSDGGDTFIQTTGPIGWALCFVDTLYGWTGGRYDYYLTLDGGETFEHYDSPGLGYTNDIDFVDRNHGWAATSCPLTPSENRGEVHKWVPDAGIIEDNNDKYAVESLILYSQKVFLGRGDIKIYDASGRFIRFIRNGYWDGRDRTGRSVSPGIYFCRKDNRIIRIIMLRRQ